MCYPVAHIVIHINTYADKFGKMHHHHEIS
jgi:hypothetical protein